MTRSNSANMRRADVRIQHSALLNYWLVTIQCKDRNKLFFDTVGESAWEIAWASRDHT